VSRKRRKKFQKRAASVDEWADPDVADPRAQLRQTELGQVNREAARLAAELEGWSRAAISRLLAERVVSTGDVASATLEVFEDLREAPGQVIPIASVADVDRGEVSIEGTVERLWEPSHPKIAQVGLIADDTGKIKFTSWVKSDPRIVQEGDTVRLYGVKKNWYEGRCSVAVTYWSRMEVKDRGR